MKKGLQALILTEHHYLWGNDEIQELRHEAEVPEAFHIFAAQEVSVSGFGHVLVFGAPESITDKFTLETLHEMYPGVVCIWAHPFRKGNVPREKKMLHPLLSGLEIFSLNHTIEENYRGLRLWHANKFTAISGSDSHAFEMAGVFPTQFDHPVSSIGELAAEIREGRCHPFFKEIPKSGSNVVVTEITIGTKGEDEARSRIIVRNFASSKKWAKEKQTIAVNSEIYKNGFFEGVYRVPKIIQVNEFDRVVIEEGQRGKTLFDLMTRVHPSVGKDYFSLASQWLARLHALRLDVTGRGKAVQKERKRFESYRNSFLSTDSPYCEQALSLIDYVYEEEMKLMEEAPVLVQVHGDFHPKNIIIGQDYMHDVSTMFISVIDFGNSLVMPKSFDIGYFLAQCEMQFFHFSHVRDLYAGEAFTKEYFDIMTQEDQQGSYGLFCREVGFFKLRGFLSIAAFLIKVGKGTSVEMETLVRKMEEGKRSAEKINLT